MKQQDYLIAIAVGPVQEFIASARKLRDLWYGSDLLSELSKAAARSLHENGCNLIFPAVDNAERLAANSSLIVSNKLLAVVRDCAAPGELVKKTENAFKAHWQDICQRAARELPANAIDRERFDAQVKDFGEFFAAWTPLADDYQASRETVEKLLAGRKNLREFNAPGWDDAGLPKSSLDGIRGSVLKDGSSALLKNRYALKQGEHLDALGIVKRLGPSLKPSSLRPHFESLAEVAILTYLAGLNKDLEAQAILKGLPDGSALFREVEAPPEKNPSPLLPVGFPKELLFSQVTKRWIEEYGLHKDSSWQGLLKTLRRLYRRTGEPLPYACLLVADGDHMGKTIDQMTGLQQHGSFSAALDNFAVTVHEDVEAVNGGLVYSGGDDVMAYVPLHGLWQCAEAMNRRFAASMAAGCPKLKQQPTFSVGAVIVHFNTPLHEVLELARKAETYAKDRGGRNSFCLIQSKRSGSDLCIVGKWQEMAGRLPLMIDMYCEGRLSTRLGYQLRKVAAEVGAELTWQQEQDGRIVPATPAAAEATRYIGRKKTKQGEDMPEEDRGVLLRCCPDIRSLADHLVIAQQLGNAQDMARGHWSTMKAEEEE